MLQQDTVFNFLLNSGVALSEEVVVTATRRESNVNNAQMGKVNLPIEQIRSVPAFLGEVDLLKVVQLLPGVRNAGEGSAGNYAVSYTPLTLAFSPPLKPFIFFSTSSHLHQNAPSRERTSS